MSRNGSVRINGKGFGVWEESVNESEFRDAVFLPLIAKLRARGWVVTEDPHIVKQFKSLRKYHRVGTKGPLFCSVSVSGRHIEFKVWSEDFKAENPNGHRYDFNVRGKMPPMTRRRLDNEVACVSAWLSTSYGYRVDRLYDPTRKLTVEERVREDNAQCGHMDDVLGHPRVSAYNNKTADGSPLRNGATVWARRGDGRVIRGKLLIRSGSYHAVVTSPYQHERVLATQVMYSAPEDLGRKVSDRVRRARLEGELRRAIAAHDFGRAQLVQRIIFGDERPVRILAKDKTPPFNYYATNSAGYADHENAGRFTLAEAERLCKGHSDLEIIGAPSRDAGKVRE